MQALGPFNNSTSNCVSFLRLLACNGAVAAWAPAVWEERECLCQGVSASPWVSWSLQIPEHILGAGIPQLCSQQELELPVAFQKMKKKKNQHVSQFLPFCFSPFVVLPNNRKTLK